MDSPHLKKRFFIPTFLFLFLLTFLTPVFANLFPFGFNKIIPPDQYSQREEQIKRYNDQAIELFEEGHFEEAQELWEKAIEIMESRDHHSQEQQMPFEELESDDEGTVLSGKEGKSDYDEIEELYQSAVSLFKTEKYVAAKKMFDRVESRIPDYKATRNYLTILSHKIKRAQQSLSDDKIKEDSISRLKEREEWKRILEESEKELEEKLLEQISPLYQEAVGLYKSRKFGLAKDYFLEVDSIMPNHKDTTKYLVRIEDDIRAEEQRILEEENRKKVLERKKEQEEWQRIIEESELKLHNQMLAQVEPIYQEALDYYKQRQFELAKDRFLEIEQILPDYRSVKNYLTRIDQDVQEEAKRREQQRLRELEREEREENIAGKRAEERLAQLREEEEKKKIAEFQEEVAARRKDREAWLKILEENETERKRKLEDQAEYVYQEAIQLYKRQQFKQAKEDFLEAERIIPDYKSTAKYLAKIDQDIEEEEKQRSTEQQRIAQQKVRVEQIAQREQEEELERLRAIEDQNRLRNFKEQAAEREKQRKEWERVLTKNEQERQKRLTEEAEFVYKEALQLYKEKKWERARNGFIEAQQIIPGYKGSEKYLARIDRDSAQEAQRRKLASEESIQRQRHEEELARNQEEERLKKLIETDQKKALEQKKKQVAAVYQLAQSLYKRGDYARAKDKFLEVQQILPGYESTALYIGRIDEDGVKDKKRYENEQRIAIHRQLREKKIEENKEGKKLGQGERAEQEKWTEQLKKETLARQKEREEWEKINKESEAKNQKRLNQQAELIYQEALRYFEAGWFEQAQEAFEEVESTVSGYKSTAKYLEKVNKKIKQEAHLHQESEKRIQEYLKKEEMLRAKRQTEADAWKLKIAKENRGQKIMSQAEQQPVEKADLAVPEENGNVVIKKAVEERQKELSQEAEEKYREALSAYKAKEFIEAKLKFIEVESFSPGYKATLKYLKSIDEKIANQKRNLDQERVIDAEKKFDLNAEEAMIVDRDDFVQQVLLEEERNFQKAKTKKSSEQKRIKKQEPQKRETVKKRKGQEIDKKDLRKELKKQRLVVQQEYETQFRQMYDEAVQLFRSGSYDEAKELFSQIEQMKPGYKKTASYLKKASVKIQKGLQKEENNNVARTKKIKTRSDIVGDALDAFEQKL